MNTKFRKYRISDSDIVSELIHEFYKEYSDCKPMLPQKIARTFDSLTKHPDRGTIMVFENDGQVIGYSILVNYWSNEFGGNIINIDEVYVKKDFRSQGIARAFIKYLLDRNIGKAVALQLEVTPNNIMACNLYKSIGFKLCENRIYYLKI